MCFTEDFSLYGHGKAAGRAVRVTEEGWQCLSATVTVKERLVS